MDSSVSLYLRDHARQLQKHPMTIASATMRYRSQAGFELLAAMATGGAMGYAEVLGRLRELVASGSSAKGDEFDVVAVAALARARASWPGPAFDFTEAADLHQATRLLLSDGRSRAGLGLPRYTDRLDAQCNLAVGRVDYVSSILPKIWLDDESRWMFETELAHPQLGLAGSTVEGWLRSFNRLFEDRGLMPITLGDGGGALFDRIEPATTPVSVDAPGPTVSIIMSVFKPDASLVTSLRSLMSQTWPHLQVLVVDDCSPDDYQPLIEEAAALDDRIELHRMPANGGTYKIRNFAMGVARGEFIAFQDSDDWSHPERIERQLRPLLDDPDLMASLSRAVRLEAGLSQNKVGFSSLRQNASSLLFRREPVLSALSGYDEVRKAADSEFTSRLEAVFGTSSIRDLELPLALVQLTSDSLSRGEFMFGWRNANRVFYRESYEHWHTGITTKEARLVPGAPRSFPAPPAFIGVPLDPDRHCDVVLVSDWRQGVSRYEGAPAEVAALADAGLTIASVQAETMRFARRERVAPARETMDLRASGALTPVRWEDPLRARLALVRDPELLSYPRGSASSQLRAERVVIVAGHPPTSPAGDCVYDPAVVDHHARELFGGEPEWLPANEGIASSLATLPDRAVHAPQLLGAVPRASIRRSGLRGGTRPVIGATADALWNDPPGWKHWLETFPDDDAYDVRIRDSERAVASLAAGRPVPPNWLLTDEPSDAAFVGQLDFLVGMPIRSAGLEPVQVALSAMAQGCVVLLDPAYEPAFGPAALYLRGMTARQLVDEMVDRPDRHREQQARGYAFVDAELSPTVFAGRVGVLLAGAERKESA